MSKTTHKSNGTAAKSTDDGNLRLTVSGFKSISEEQTIEIRPLTILAGANSSGKSSIMQPLLLLKQTLEQTFDPGPLWLGGPNVRFNSTTEFCSHLVVDKRPVFTVSLAQRNESCSVQFDLTRSQEASLEKCTLSFDGRLLSFREGMTNNEMKSNAPWLYNPNYVDSKFDESADVIRRLRSAMENGQQHFNILKSRFILEPRISFVTDDAVLTHDFSIRTSWFKEFLTNLLHVSGTRGIPTRAYTASGPGPKFPGTFDKYTGSLVLKWQTEGDAFNSQGLASQLALLRLGEAVGARRIDANQIEVLVNAAPSSDRMVSIADMGLGVSYAMPFLVALEQAEPGQIVYIEEPEIHLHPRAQRALASVLARAAKRSVRVVAETHSSLLLQGIQTLVAEGGLDPTLVALHWFSRNDEGITHIDSHDLDETGAFGDWPEDFDDVALESEAAYIRAAGARARTGIA